MGIDEDRINKLLQFGEEIKKREDGINKMKDIRNRDWMHLDTKVSKILRLLLDAENELMDLDDYQLWNGQEYSAFEDFYNQLSDFRERYTKYIDEHKELLTMDDKINQYFNK